MILSNRALRTRVLEIFDQTFAITYGLEAIALVVAVLGVLNSLLASVLERTREIGILRSVGFTRGGIVRSILWEAGLMGALANLLGALAGLPAAACSGRFGGRRIAGSIVGGSLARGHLLRERRELSPSKREEVAVAILGAGAAGLSAAWAFERAAASAR